MNGSAGTTLITRQFFNSYSPGSVLVSVKQNINTTLYLGSIVVRKDSFATKRVTRIIISPGKPVYRYNGRKYLRSFISNSELRRHVSRSPTTHARVLARTNTLLKHIVTVPTKLLSLHSVSMCNTPRVIGARFVSTVRGRVDHAIAASCRRTPRVRHYERNRSLALHKRTAVIVHALIPAVRRHNSLVNRT